MTTKNTQHGELKNSRERCERFKTRKIQSIEYFGRLLFFNTTTGIYKIIYKEGYRVIFTGIKNNNGPICLRRRGSGNN